MGYDLFSNRPDRTGYGMCEMRMFRCGIRRVPLRPGSDWPTFRF